MSPDGMDYVLIYEDSDLKLLLNNHDGSDCFITFTSWGRGHVNGFGQQFLDARKMSGLYFISKWDHWWHTPGMGQAIKLAKDALEQAAFSRIIVYGASMGGFGAVLYAADFKATLGILIAPQFEIRPNLPPFETRWAFEAKAISFSEKDMRSAVKPNIPLYIIYDPSSYDKAHVDLFAGLTTVTGITVWFGGHTPHVMLAQIGLLKDVVFDLIYNQFDHAIFLKRVRQNRRRSAVFWAALADKAERSHPELAFSAVREACKLSPKDVVYTLRLIYLLLARGKNQEALALAQRATELAPSHPAPWRALAKCHQSLGDAQEAVSTAKKAVRLRENDADLHRVLLDALMASNCYDEAVRVAKTAISLDPKFQKTLQILRSAEAQLSKY